MPPEGLWVWKTPDPNASSVDSVPGGTQVELVEEAAHGWARIRWAGEREGWVDGRKLLRADAPAHASTSAAGSRRWLWVAVVVLVLGATGGVIAVVASQGGDDDVEAADGDGSDDGESGGDPGTGRDAPDGSQDSTDGDSGLDGPAGTGGEGGDTDGPDLERTAVPFALDDALTDEAIVRAESSPLPGPELPGRDLVATSAFAQALSETGVDMIGVDVVVFPAGSVPAFALITVDESAPIVTEEGAGDLLFMELLESAVLAAREVDRVVMRYSSSDEDGPYTISFTAVLSELSDVVGTETDVSEHVSVQVDRP